MKQAGKLAEQARQQVSQAASTGKAITHATARVYRPESKPAPAKLVDAVFAKMLVKYQQRWSSMMPDEALEQETAKEWAEQLAGFSLQAIKYALDACLDNYPDWPPNPGQFRQLCKMGEVEPDYKPLQLENPPDPETVAREIGKMKENIKR